MSEDSVDTDHVVHDTPGCSRCRMDLIRFTREVVLPRFTMRVGETWNLPQNQRNSDGMLSMGGGYVPVGSYETIKVDHVRAIHNFSTCPGNSGSKQGSD